MRIMADDTDHSESMKTCQNHKGKKTGGGKINDQAQVHKRIQVFTIILLTPNNRTNKVVVVVNQETKMYILAATVLLSAVGPFTNGWLKPGPIASIKPPDQEEKILLIYE